MSFKQLFTPEGGGRAKLWKGVVQKMIASDDGVADNDKFTVYYPGDKRKITMSMYEMSEPEKLAELRRQIEMRTVGCGWTQFETKWGFFSDERSHKIVDLKRMLLDDILPHEIQLRRLNKLPTEARRPRSALR